MPHTLVPCGSSRWRERERERVIQIDGVDIEVAREWVGLRVAWWPGRLINWRESTCVCVCVYSSYAKYLCLYVSKAPHLNYTQGLSGLSPLLIFRPVRQLDDTLFRCDFFRLFFPFFVFQRYFLKPSLSPCPTSAITLISYVIDYGVLCRACRDEIQLIFFFLTFFSRWGERWLRARGF